jgi:hypothetical protein
MITIKNIDAAIGDSCNGRTIYHISNHINMINEHSYVFEFDAVLDARGYYKPQQVHLIRSEKPGTQGLYKLFVMGIAAATERLITKEMISDRDVLLFEISKCLKTAEHWWSTKTI